MPKEKGTKQSKYLRDYKGVQILGGEQKPSPNVSFRQDTWPVLKLAPAHKATKSHPTSGQKSVPAPAGKSSQG